MAIDNENDFFWIELRNERNKLLQSTDYTQLLDHNLSNEQRFQWAQYRQSLRDLPANTPDPKKAKWPAKPGEPPATPGNSDKASP